MRRVLIEDSGTTVMDPGADSVMDPVVAADARGLGVAILEEPSHVGDTQRMRAHPSPGPALPFRPAGEGSEPAVDEASPGSARTLPEEPEAYTMELRGGRAAGPALPFTGRDTGPLSTPSPARAPALPFVGGEAAPISTPSPPSAGVRVESQWAAPSELDPSELPSAHLAEIAAPPPSVERRAARRATLRPGVVLLLLALLVGGLLVAAAMLRW